MITYRVERGTTAVVDESDTNSLKTVEVWTVTRVTDGFGWHIGRYTDEETAMRIAEILADASTKEIA